MMWSIVAALSAGIGSAVLFSFLFNRRILSRLWNCECEIADIMDRHLRTVRREAAKERWDKETQLDLALDQAIAKPAPKKGWTKWPSSAPSESSLAEQ